MSMRQVRIKLTTLENYETYALPTALLPPMFFYVNLGSSAFIHASAVQGCVLECRPVPHCHNNSLILRTIRMILLARSRACVNEHAAGEDRTHNLRIMRPTCYQLRCCRLCSSM